MYPKVSIIMGTYNRAALLPRAFQSVAEQSFSDWEFIITDDGSTDDTPSVVHKLQNKDSRIVYLRNEENLGISKNYNIALRHTRGIYIAMIDDDDAWIGNDKLEKQMHFLEKNQEYVGCGGGVVVVDLGGKELYRYLKPETDSKIRDYALYSNPMANSTTLFRRKIGEKVGWYDETQRYSGDRDFWLKMGCEGKLYNFPNYFSYYTMNGQNTSIIKLRPHLKASFIIMRRYRNKYPHYYTAFLFNFLQYCYSFLPKLVVKKIHTFFSRIKRVLVK